MNATVTTENHTPGPWEVDERIAASFRSSAIVAGEIVIADTTRIPEYKANARLIAAAPDLLEALKLLYREMELSGNLGSKDYGWRPATIAAQTAIAKAEGRS